MKTECPACSQTDTERSNPQGEALCDKPASRNASKLDSTSLRYKRVASLTEMVKPETVDEETFRSSQLTLRGGWRQHAGKDKLRNLGDPTSEGEKPKELREDITEVFTCWESDRFIVVRKQGNACGAKESYCKRVTIKANATD